MSLLKDRTFILLALMFFILILIMAAGLYASSSNAPDSGLAGGWKVGQNLTEQQKSLVLDIAMNDPVLKTELSGNVSEAGENYHIKDISVAQYEDAG